jgi:hypothetical protein
VLGLTLTEQVPDYAFDCHTLKGKRKGKTKADFFREEQRALKPFRRFSQACSTNSRKNCPQA